jgi:hypothetical protein
LRKTWAIILTAFYLSLSTGTYACLLHCSTDFLVAQFSSDTEIRSHEKGSPHDQAEDEDDDCRSGNCSCCYHHGTYVIGENYHAQTAFTFHAMHAAALPAVNMARPDVPLTIKAHVSWPRATGPPYLAGLPLYISNRTLQI